MKRLWPVLLVVLLAGTLAAGLSMVLAPGTGRSSGEPLAGRAPVGGADAPAPAAPPPAPDPSAASRRRAQGTATRGPDTSPAGGTAPGHVPIMSPPKSSEDEAARGADQPEGDPSEEGEPVQSAWPLNREGIQGAVLEVLPRMKGCYEAALADIPDLAGEMVVVFSVSEVDGVGEVTGVELSSDGLGDYPMEACVLESMGSLQFDAPAEGSMSVTYPVNFSPG